MTFWNLIQADSQQEREPMKKILVIGAGASGMMAAIQAAEHGSKVTVYERNDRVGRKILATGNGKCNLTNLCMGSEYFYCDNPKKLERYLETFSNTDTIRFFETHGLMLRDRDGYVYPYCEQASVVLDVLRNALNECNITVKTMVKDIKIESGKKEDFSVVSSAGKEVFDAVILACGSRAGIKNPDTSGYGYAKAFGHTIHKLLPALVQVRCHEDFFPMVSGVRCKVRLSLLCNNVKEAEETGELQLTDYGISGIPVFQISREIAGNLAQKKAVSVLIDFLPDMTETEWVAFYSERLKQYVGRCAENFLLGILHKKLSIMLLKQYGIKTSECINKQNEGALKTLCESMKHFTVTPKEVNSFEQAQVCRGGVDFNELDDKLQSVFKKNLYICGEMVDVDGKCGGYNLQWAWTSGCIAGIAASE